MAQRASILPDPADSYRAIRVEAQRAAQHAIRELHPRELEVLQLIARGNGKAAIAVSLGIGTETVRSHIWRITGKTKVRGLVNLSRLAMRAGLTSLWAGDLVQPGRKATPSGRAPSR